DAADRSGLEAERRRSAGGDKSNVLGLERPVRLGRIERRAERRVLFRGEPRLTREEDADTADQAAVEIKRDTARQRADAARLSVPKQPRNEAIRFRREEPLSRRHERRIDVEPARERNV